VLTELARLDLHGDQAKTKASAPATAGPSGGSFLYRPINWYGGMLIKAEETASAVVSRLTVQSVAGDKHKAA